MGCKTLLLTVFNTFAPTAERPFVLRFTNGGTPLQTYKELIKLYHEEVSFKYVVTFNMDEYRST